MNHHFCFFKHTLSGGILLSLLLSVCQAHDTFLRADEYWIKSDDPAFIHVLNGSFNRSISTFPDNRLKRLMVSAPDKVMEIPLERLVQNQTKNKIWKLLQEIDGLFGGVNERYTRTLEFQPETSGTYQAALELKTNRIAMTAAQHRNYLETEAHVDPNSYPFPEDNPDGVAVHRYVKIAKIIIQVKDTPTHNLLKPMGLITEIVPLSNPASITQGQMFEFQLIHNFVPAPHETALVSRGKEGSEVMKVTGDAEGICRFTVTAGGPWWINFIHIKSVGNEDEVDYDDWMSTLSFEIK